MRVLNEKTLMDRVATKLAEIRNLNTVIAFLDELGIRASKRTDDTPLKDYALSRLKNVDAKELQRIAEFELDMDVSDLLK